MIRRSTRLIILLAFVYLFLPRSSAYAQWTEQCTLDNGYYPWLNTHNTDFVFTSADTGFFCMWYGGGTPSSDSDVRVFRTTNGGQEWSHSFFDSYDITSAKKLKYYDPYVIFWYDIFFASGCKKLDPASGGWTDCFPGMISWCWGSIQDIHYHGLDRYSILVNKICDDVYHLVNWDSGSVVVRDTFYENFPKQVDCYADTICFLRSNHAVMKQDPNTDPYQLISDTNRVFHTMDVTNTGNVFIGCDSGIVLRSINGGVVWDTIQTGFVNTIRSVFFLNDSAGYAVGNSGMVLRTTDYGQTWTKQVFPSSGHCTKVQFLGDSLGFIRVGDRIYRTTDAGNTWISEFNSIDKHVLLYPNPCSDHLSIKGLPAGMMYSIEIYSLNGQLVRQNSISGPDALVYVGQLENATYSVIIQSENDAYASRHKLVILRR